MAYTTIDKPTDYFNTVLYTGNGSTNAITGVGFQPDFIWCKARSIGYDHRVFNSISGVGKYNDTGNAGVESSDANSITAFGTDGFTLGSEAGGNANSQTFVSWNWLGANGTASNTDGSITSTVSANTTSGFSIVAFAGTGSNATVGHGLSSAPKVIILKNRDAGDSWIVGHGSIGFTKFTKLDEYSASGTSSGFFNDTTPTSSVFSVGNQNDVNASGQNIIAYCFSEVKSFSKFGSYVGNGSSDGSYIHLGFKPAFVLFKKTSGSAANWQLWDNKRDPANPVEEAMHPDSSSVPSADQDIDFLSNGFKLRSNVAHLNENGVVFIYMAFAESPFTTSTGIPTTAR